MIKGDEFYEERAIDVTAGNPPPDLIQSRNPTAESPQAETKSNVNVRESMIKIKKPQGGGTVRNIPIKDYQASIAANFGTIRKSMLPQQQFESLVSEPEKGLHLGSKTKQRVNLIPRVREGELMVSQRSDVVPDSLLSGSNVTGENRETNFSKKEPRRRTVDQETRASRRHFETYVRTIENLEKDMRSTEKDSAVDLQRGHVVQKISVYEGNSREPRRRSIEITRRRQLGVPLVGMHNACGLPVIAPWPTQVNINPIQTPKKKCPVKKIPLAVPPGKTRTQPKRRAPQPKKFASNSRSASGNRNSNYDSKKQTKNQRRPSFRVYRINTFPSRHFGDSSRESSTKTTFRSVKSEAKRRSPLFESLGRKSLKRGSTKRRTLYAKDDGDEAVKVLSTLCLNPLARGKEAMNMMW